MYLGFLFWVVLQSRHYLFLTLAWKQVRASILRAGIHKVIWSQFLLKLTLSTLIPQWIVGLLIIHSFALNEDTWLNVLNQFDKLIGREMCSFITNTKRDHVAFLASCFLTVESVFPTQVFLISLHRGLLFFLLLWGIQNFLSESLTDQGVMACWGTNRHFGEARRFLGLLSHNRQIEIRCRA